MRAEPLTADNWRPTLVSAAVGGIVAVAAILAVAVAAGAIGPTALGAVSGGLLAVAVRTATRSTYRGASAVSGAFALAAGLAAVGGLVAALVAQFGLPPERPLPLLEFAPLSLFLAGGLVGFGAPAAMWGLDPGSDLGAAAVRVLAVALPPVVAGGFAAFGPPVGPLVDLAADVVLLRGAAAPAGPPTLQLVVTSCLVLVAALSVRAALGAVPLVELAGEGAEPEVEAAVANARGAAGWLAVVAGLSAFVLGPTVQIPAQLYGRVPAALHPLLFAYGGSRTLRWLLVACAVGGVVAVAAVWLLRAAANDRFRPDSAAAGTLTVGGLFVLAGWLSHRAVETRALEAVGSDAGRRTLAGLFGSVGSFPLTLAAVSLGLGVAALALSAAGVAGGLGVLGEPPGAHLAATGGISAAVGAAVAELALPWVLLPVAAGLFAWDLGEYAAGLGEELGRAGRTRRGEAVHVTAAAALSAVGIGAALAAERLADSLSAAATAPGTTAVLVALAAVAGTLVSLAAAR